MLDPTYKIANLQNLKITKAINIEYLQPQKATTKKLAPINETNQTIQGKRI
ncbi:hypothetical protein [Nostoc sp.]|uniref:hypothetical protein n=1 Tax=Nostoc sp. TaxID=1180 RepID=UPI002FFCA9B5